MVASCIFCRIGAGEVPVKAVYEDDEFIAFPDMHPQAPVHLLVIPKGHYPTLYDFQDAGLLGRLTQAAGQAARGAGVDQSGFRLALNTGPDAGQEVPHIHFHLLGGRHLRWPPG